MDMTFVDYRDLIDDNGDNRGFTRKHLKEVFSLVYKKADKFHKRVCEKYKQMYNVDISNYITEVNMDLFERALLDAFADLKRIKEFHAVSNPVNIKYASYIAYWWIQRKPFQMTNNRISIDKRNDQYKLIQSRVLNFNEYFAVYFMLSTIFNAKTVVCSIEHNEEWERAEKYLFYFLCFRASSPKSIEAFLSAAILHPSWEISKNIR